MSFRFLPVKIILLSVDFSLMLLTCGWIGIVKKMYKRLFGQKLRSVPINGVETHRVMKEFKGNLAVTPTQGAFTLYDLTKDTFSRYEKRRCMGTREFLTQTPDKVKVFGGVIWKTYEQVGVEMHKFGAALRSVGVVPAPEKASLTKFTTPCSIAIFENTCAEWMIAAQGAFSQSIIVTTIYATLGPTAVVDAVNDGIINTIVCNKTSVATILQKISDMPTLKTIIYTSALIPSDQAIDIPHAPADVTVVSFEDFVESGNIDEYPPTPPTAETTAVIMYTSGSTGKPKGVVLTHKNVVAEAASVYHLLPTYTNDVYIAYLPLAHIMELMGEFLFLSKGVTIVYSDPKSLTSKGATPGGALETFSPTIMIAVPKVWDSIKKGVEAKIESSSPLRQYLVKTAFQARKFAKKVGYSTPLFNALVFKKFEAALGGKIRFALSGGGALNSEVQDFIRVCFGIPFIQGYGLTETCAAVTAQATDDNRSGIAGVPVPSAEVKLESTPEILDRAGLPYLTTDTKDHEGNDVFGRGEVIVKGNNIAVGYYMMEDKTKEEFREDGFFCTGDIGQYMSDGSIRIVDRKKNLIKLKGGEYIAIENMEMVYGNSPFVDTINGGICCYGDGDMDRPIALMQLNVEYARKWASKNGLEGNIDELKTSKNFHDAVLQDMMAEAKKGGLTKLEKLVGLSFVHMPWTTSNGCLTASNKLQRKKVISMFAKQFEETKPKGIF